jgi:hypothetical protein
LSVDDARLAVSLVDPKTSMPDIWLTDLVRGGVARFTFGPQLNSSPQWSPDGSQLAYRSNGRGMTELYQKSSGTGGDEQLLISEDLVRLSGLGASNVIATDCLRGIRPSSAVRISGSMLSRKAARRSSWPILRRSSHGTARRPLHCHTSNESDGATRYVETIPRSIASGRFRLMAGMNRGGGKMARRSTTRQRWTLMRC